MLCSSPWLDPQQAMVHYASWSTSRFPALSWYWSPSTVRCSSKMKKPNQTDSTCLHVADLIFKLQHPLWSPQRGVIPEQKARSPRPKLKTKNTCQKHQLPYIKPKLMKTHHQWAIRSKIPSCRIPELKVCKLQSSPVPTQLTCPNLKSELFIKHLFFLVFSMLVDPRIFFSAPQVPSHVDKPTSAPWETL